MAGLGWTICSAAAGADLTASLEQIAKPIGGRVGVSAVLIESGEHVALHGDQPFFMASVVKFPVALRVLQLVDSGRLRLDQKVVVGQADIVAGSTVLGDSSKAGTQLTVRELLNDMIGASDNTSCDVLLRLTGGTKAAMEHVQALGIQGIRIDRTEKQMAADFARSHAKFLKDPRDTSTPDAMAALLAKFQMGETLKPATTALLREMMQTPSRIGALLPAGTIVAHKTGTWRNAAINDAGIITLPGGARHIAVAIFTNHSKRPLPKVEQVIAGLAQSLYRHWSTPPVK